MRAERRGPSPTSDLPAPYISPWRRLGGDLEAVGADLVLRARTLWRRNAEGSLWRPRFWPRAWGAVFLPLLLVLALVVAAVPALGPGSGPAPSPPLPPPPEPALKPPGPEATAATPAGSEQPPGREPDAAGVPPSASEPGLVAADDPAFPNGAAPVQEPGPGPPAAEGLKALFAATDMGGMIVAAVPEAALSLVRLEVSEGFARLEPGRRRQLAEDWAGVAAGRGYERLEVVDGGGRLWIHPAAVGGGLVVLAYPMVPEPG